MKKAKGFYTGVMTLSDNGKLYDYDYIVHISEIERYKNEYSKIKLDKIEVTKGFNDSDFKRVKKYIKNEFASIKLTNNITWLESSKSLNEERKEKLNKLNKSFFSWIK